MPSTVEEGPARPAPCEAGPSPPASAWTREWLPTTPKTGCCWNDGFQSHHPAALGRPIDAAFDTVQCTIKTTHQSETTLHSKHGHHNLQTVHFYTYTLGIYINT